MRAFLLLIALCLALTFSGCGTPGALPYVSPTANVQTSTWTVQGAEKTLLAARDTLDLFLGLDDTNRVIVNDKLPKVHKLAEKLRKDNYAINLLERADR